MGGCGESRVIGRGCAEPLLVASLAPGPWKFPLVFGLGVASDSSGLSGYGFCGLNNTPKISGRGLNFRERT